MVSLGSGCPWGGTICWHDDGVDRNTIDCNFGGADGHDVEAAVSDDGTVLGPAPSYPGSGISDAGLIWSRYCLPPVTRLYGLCCVPSLPQVRSHHAAPCRHKRARALRKRAAPCMHCSAHMLELAA